MHYSLCQKVVDALHSIFQGGEYADKVIERSLKADKRQGARDRAFIAEQVYEVVRHARLLWEIDGQGPQHEADWWRLLGIHFVLRDKTLPPFEHWRGLDPAAIRARHAALLAQPAIAQSVPDWLHERGSRELGPLWPDTLAALNQGAQVVLRTNTLKTHAEDLRRQLGAEGFGSQIKGTDALVLAQRGNVFRTAAFKAGHFEVQDYSSQQVAPFLDPQPGERVVDACAGGGGKTLHLAALMRNKGHIIALDTEAWKLEALRQRARRAGAHIIEARPILNSKTIKRLRGSADRLLLDVPCSGLGVLRRNPDAKWKLDSDFIGRVQAEQQHILRTYSQMLKAGGTMVYATCSILPSENQEQVEHFLQQPEGADFELLAEKRILPQDEGFDGFYMARLRKRP